MGVLGIKLKENDISRFNEIKTLEIKLTPNGWQFIGSLLFALFPIILIILVFF